MIKHFLDIDDFNIKELRDIINYAKKIKYNQKKYSSILNDKHIGLIFEKQSMRTRLSFSVGIQKLGGKIIELSYKQIGFGERESPEDILKVSAQYLDALIIRNDDHSQLVSLAALDVIPIVNGLSNFSHPCQILSDIFTIEEALGEIESKQITWLGDFNNVLVSLIQSAEIFKFKLNILIPFSFKKKFKQYFIGKKIKHTTFFDDIDMGLKNSDCVMTDTWISMGEKNNLNKKKLLKKFQVNEMIMSKAKKNAIFMHCLPAHRNEEVTDLVIDGSQSVVWQQAQNRTFVQQSILNNILNNV